MSAAILTRYEFREGVFSRDGHACVVCDQPGADAHHIIERKLFPDGGYYLDNGVTLCAHCHILAESTQFTCEFLRDQAGIETVCLPPHFSDDETYDKWGNVILRSGQRLRGELFDEESVQKVLQPVLHEFTDRVKYPRTFHFPSSPGLQNDDRVLQSIDQWRGMEVVVTEKLDGECLAAKTRITMADMSEIKIRQIVNRNLVGQYVLGQDDKGSLVPSRITRVYNNGRTDDWLRVKVKGAHGPFHSIYCTPNEQFFVPTKGYVEARSLTPNDTLLSVRTSLNITDYQRQVLLGKLLGDGSFHVGRNRKRERDHERQIAQIQWSHKTEHAEYTNHVATQLGSLGAGVTPCTSGYGSPMLKASSRSTHAIYREFQSFIENGRKCVPEWVEHALSPISIAFWYMDDGTLQHSEAQRDRAQFSTCGFSEQECVILQRGLARFGIHSTLHYYDYWYISVPADSAEQLFELIAPYIPAVMQYKLPENYRGRYVVEVLEENCTELWSREVPIAGIDNQVPINQRIKYDIETETHNFFANGVLVHNCTTLYSDYMHARSLDYEPHPSRTFIRSIWGSVAYDIPDWMRICGENVTAVHSIEYGNLESYFYVFSIWNSCTCLSWDDTVEYAGALNLQTVPLMYRGPWRESLVGDLSALLDTEHQEGFVLRPTAAFKLRDFPRMVGKWVRRGHVQTSEHWKQQPVRFNKLKDKES